MAKILVVDEPLSPAVPVADGAVEAPGEPIEDSRSVLSRLAAVPGVTLAVLVDREGFLIESAGDLVLEAEAAGALAGCLAEASEAIGRELGQGTLVGLIAEYEAGLILVNRADSGTMLYIHRSLPDDNRGNLISLATGDERTLFFDFLPCRPTVRNFVAKFQLYTVPGQVYYNMTRKLVLRGVDGIVFVADSQWDRLQENLESFKNLEENLREYDNDLAELPYVIQYNKRDLPNVAPVDTSSFSSTGDRGACPIRGRSGGRQGVFDTLNTVSRMVLVNGFAQERGRPMIPTT